jgi:L-alanine-DL-glutamate epimerase-like enolase superfamily enzyme
MPARVAVRDIAFFERRVDFARPFQFGVSTVTAAPQVFVRVAVDVEGVGTSIGASAEMMAPKWFDKRPALSPEATIDELRRALRIARELYLSESGFETPFGLHAARVQTQREACAKQDIPALAAMFGPAEIDKAIIDAVLRAYQISFFGGMATNIAGLDTALTPDIDDAALVHFLKTRSPPSQVAVRHTVGLRDDIDDLHAEVLATGCRYFKLKLGGDVAADAMRLAAIGKVLDAVANASGRRVAVTVDANEQYADLAALTDLCVRLRDDDRLSSIASRLLYIEQPLPRELTLETPLGGLGSHAIIIDEADDGYDAFPNAKALGYRGVSSKSCKGVYKALLNGARAATWSTESADYFVAAEDLTCHPGLALQQDMALGACLGVSHAERNGHHYVDGFAGAPQAEAETFLAGHSDLYHRTADGIRVAIHDGALSTRSLAGRGFASCVHPDWTSLDPPEKPANKIVQETTV